MSPNSRALFASYQRSSTCLFINSNYFRNSENPGGSHCCRSVGSFPTVHHWPTTPQRGVSPWSRCSCPPAAMKWPAWMRKSWQRSLEYQQLRSWILVVWNMEEPGVTWKCTEQHFQQYEDVGKYKQHQTTSLALTWNNWRIPASVFLTGETSGAHPAGTLLSIEIM